MQTSADERIWTKGLLKGGVVTRAEIVAAGVGTATIQRRLSSGSLELVGRGVYLVAKQRTERTHWWIALALVARSWLSHTTAGDAHGLSAVPSRRTETHVVVDLGGVRPMDGAIVVHRTKHLPIADVMDLDGLRVTTPARTLCDLGAILRRPQLQHVIEQAVVANKVNQNDLLACRSAYVRRGRGGSARLNLVLDDLFDDEPAERSELERRFRALLEGSGITGFVEQFRPPWYDGLRGAVDFAHREAKVIVEVDGRRWHAVTQSFDEDRRRDRRAQAEGWVVLRFGWHEVVNRPGAVAAEIAAVLVGRL